jgi:hypothetical protein
MWSDLIGSQTETEQKSYDFCGSDCTVETLKPSSTFKMIGRPELEKISPYVVGSAA